MRRPHPLARRALGDGMLRSARLEEPTPALRMVAGHRALRARRGLLEGARAAHRRRDGPTPRGGSVDGARHRARTGGGPSADARSHIDRRPRHLAHRWRPRALHAAFCGSGSRGRHAGARHERPPHLHRRPPADGPDGRAARGRSLGRRPRRARRGPGRTGVGRRGARRRPGRWRRGDVDRWTADAHRGRRDRRGHGCVVLA